MLKSVKVRRAEYNALRSYAAKNGHSICYVITQAIKLFLESKQEKAA